MSYTSEVKSKGYSISIVEAETQLLGTKDFDRMSSETLECIYRFAFGRWPYHMTKEAMVYYLEDYRRAIKEKS